MGWRASALPDREHLLLTAGQEAAAPITQRVERRKVPVRDGSVETLAAVAESQVLRHRQPEEEAA